MSSRLSCIRNPPKLPIPASPDGTRWLAGTQLHTRFENLFLQRNSLRTSLTKLRPCRLGYDFVAERRNQDAGAYPEAGPECTLAGSRGSG
jgi:hypothetical protein